MKKYIINGIFITHTITGVERLGYNILKYLDLICSDLNIELLIPNRAKCELKYKNIKIVRYGNKNGVLWVQFDYSKYVKKNKGTILGLGTYMPFFLKGGIVYLHDIRDIVMSDFAKFKYRLMSYLSCYFRCYWSDHIITVSEFSKSEILKNYKIKKNKISVIYNGWQHIEENNSIFNNEKFPFLKEKDYYFFLGSIAKHKNIKWIIEIAKNNPKQTFAISGKKIDRLFDDKIDNKCPNNVHFLGYLNDNDIIVFMKYCKAFVFPSLYEGFGIPPLEALSLGAKVIVSDIQVHKEIYGSTVYYINPYVYDINIDELINSKVESPASILEKYDFYKSAKELYDILKVNNKIFDN